MADLYPQTEPAAIHQEIDYEPRQRCLLVPHTLLRLRQGTLITSAAKFPPVVRTLSITGTFFALIPAAYHHVLLPENGVHKRGSFWSPLPVGEGQGEGISAIFIARDARNLWA